MPQRFSHALQSLRGVAKITAVTLAVEVGTFRRFERAQRDADPRVLEIACKAQLRLYRRYARLNAKGKPAGKVVTAVARELVGFIWAVGRETESAHTSRRAAA